MKALAAVLLGGTLLFMGVAIVQQWDFFASAWFGRAAPAPELPPEQRRAAAETVRAFLALVGHLQESGGDPRFAERLPAAPALVEELRAEADYLARNRRVQRLVLHHLDVAAVEPAGRERVEVRTREMWTVHTLWALDGRPAEAPRPSLLAVKYLLAPLVAGWRVEAWELDFETPRADVPEAGEVRP